jgi:hypothetical protein
MATAKATGKVMTPYLTPSHNDHITFGRHNGLTYAQLYQHYPKYVEWVLVQAERNCCSADLARLGTYLRTCVHDEEAKQPYTPDPNDSPDEEPEDPPLGWTVPQFPINSSGSEEMEEEFVPEELVTSVPNRYNKKRAGQIQIRAPLAFTFVPGEAASSGLSRPDLQQSGPPSFGTGD